MSAALPSAAMAGLLADLARALAALAHVDLPAALGELARLQALGLSRLASGNGQAPAPVPDVLLSPREAAQRLGCRVQRIYRGTRPGGRYAGLTVRDGRRVLVSARRLETYLARRTP